MIRYIQPLESKIDSNKLTSLLFKCLNNNSFKFLSYSLIEFEKETIENLTQHHKDNGIEYIIEEEGDTFIGVLAYKNNKFNGFELFLMVVDIDKQKKGIGQSLVNECIKIAVHSKFKAIDSFVYSDNKNMLRLLIKNDFRPIDIQFHARADGMDLIKLRKYVE